MSTDNLALAGTAVNSLGLVGLTAYQRRSNINIGKNVEENSQKINTLVQNVNVMSIAIKTLSFDKKKQDITPEMIENLSIRISELEDSVADLKMLLGMPEKKQT